MPAEGVMESMGIGDRVMRPVVSLNLWRKVHSWRNVHELKTLLCAERCPKCRNLFGPTFERTISQKNLFGTTKAPVLRFVCPHCSVPWQYCDGVYTEQARLPDEGT